MAINTVVRYRPSAAVSTRSLLDQLFEGSLRDHGSRPSPSMSANLIETPDAYVAQIALPGINTEKLEIQSINRQLRIHGEFETSDVENGTTIWNGLPNGEFNQAFTLPAEVVNDKAEAAYTNGILQITLPKADSAKVRNIPVKVTV